MRLPSAGCRQINQQQPDHQADIWHLSREVHPLTRKLEATTSSLLQEEEKARKKFQKGKRAEGKKKGLNNL
jgi:hypothetical protein